MQIAQVDAAQSAAAATANAGTFSPATIFLGLVALIPLVGLGLLIWLRLKKNSVNNPAGQVVQSFYKETEKAYSFSLIGFIFSIGAICSFIILNLVMYEAAAPTSDFPMETLILYGFIFFVYPSALFAVLISWIYQNKDVHKAFQLARLIITFVFLAMAILPFLFLRQM